MVVCGLTRVWNSPSTSPPRTLTAPISVIIAPCAAEPPVVSRSTTQKVRSRSGRPSSSKLRWASRWASRWTWRGGVLVTVCARALLMVVTLGAGTDSAR